MKEAKKYINHHKVKLSGKWYITKVRASEAVEIAFEEGRKYVHAFSLMLLLSVK